MALIGFILPDKIHSDTGNAPLNHPTPMDVLAEEPTIENTKLAIVYISETYGLNTDQLLNTIKCESSFNNLAVGDKGLAVGIAQFHKPTFEHFCTGDYYSAHDQLTCMAQMFKMGLQKHWSCWKTLYANKK